MTDLLEPKIINIKDKEFIISKFPTIKGMEIMTKMPMSAIPKLGNHPVFMDAIVEATHFVGVKINNDVQLVLSTKELIDAHIQGWEVWKSILIELFAYNCSFFQDGRLQEFLLERAQSTGKSIMKTFTEWLDQLLLKIEPLLKNYKRSIP